MSTFEVRYTFRVRAENEDQATDMAEELMRTDGPMFIDVEEIEEDE